MARSTFLERQVTDALKSRVEVNENELINVNNQIADNDSELADHESRITANRTDIEGLSTGSNGLASDIQANQNAIAANDTELADHETRLSNTETEFAAFSADGAIANSNLADMAAGTIKGSVDGGSPADLTTEEVRQLLIDDAAASASSLWSADKISTEIGSAVTSSIKYRGGYNAAENIPDLSSGSVTGDFYTVTMAGDFLGEAVEVGDSLIAEVDGASTADDWTIVNKNIDLATETSPGIVQLAADGSYDAGKVVVADDSRLHDPLTLATTALGPRGPLSTLGLNLNAQELSVDLATPPTPENPQGAYGVVSPEMAFYISQIESLLRRVSVKRGSVVSDKQLNVIDPAIQHLEVANEGDFNLLLPPDPPKDLNFEIIVMADSLGNIICNGDTLIPGDRYEIIYDGVEWVVR